MALATKLLVLGIILANTHGYKSATTPIIKVVSTGFLMFILQDMIPKCGHSAVIFQIYQYKICDEAYDQQWTYYGCNDDENVPRGKQQLLSTDNNVLLQLLILVKTTKVSYYACVF